MTRLFTFGCSFTKYSWPTWADFLGLEFEIYENWGWAGLGNRAIVERLIECHAKNHFTKDDIVIIQWTSHIRNDYHTFRYPPRDDATGWKTKGSIFNYINTEKYDKKWVMEFFDEKSYTMHMLNAIATATEILDKIGCNYAMTTIGNIENLGSDFLEAAGYNEKRNKVNLFEKYSDFDCYKQYLNTEKWTQPIGLYTWNNKDDMYHWYDSKVDEKPWLDPHPSVFLHLSWMNDILKDKLGISQILHPTAKKWIDITNELRTQTTEIETFGEACYRTLPNFQSFYRGF